MTADLQQQPQEPQEPTQAVEPPSAEAPDTAQSEPQQPPADAKPPEDDKGDKKVNRHLSSIQNRINELTRERHDERRAREAAERELMELRQHLRTAQGQAAEPKLEQFKSYDEFVDAKAAWKAEQIVAAKLDEFAKTNLQTFEQRQHQERAAHAAQQFDRALTAVEQEGKKAYPDFENVVSQGPNLGPVIGQMVLSTERPHDISYYLAKNPDHAMAIASMHPMLAMREIGKLEAQFVNKRVTSAPPPPKTITGNADSGPKGLSDELPADEWYRRRAAQLRSGKS